MSLKIFSNSLWMMSEKLISLFSVFFVTSYVAKYVGPLIYGEIVFSLAFFQVIQIISQLGSDVIIFKRVTKNVTSGVKLIKSTVYIRLLIYVVISLPVIIYSWSFQDVTSFYFSLASCVACFFISMDIAAIYYDAKLQSKKNVIVNVFSLCVCLFIRWCIAYYEMPPFWLTIPIVLTGFIPFLVRYFLFKKEWGLNVSKKGKYVKYLFRAGLSFALSSISVAIYTRLSLLMLGYFEGSISVGIYSIAATLASSWFFVGNSLIISAFANIFSERSDDVAIKKTSSLLLLIILIGFCVLIGATTIGGVFINFLYGEQYVNAYVPLLILTFSTMISLLGTVSSRFIAKYSGYTYLSKKMFLVLILSLFFNFFLIIEFGIEGAAFATLITEILSLTVFNYFFQNGLIYKLHKKIISNEHSFKF